MKKTKLFYLSISGALILTGLIFTKCSKNESMPDPGIKSGLQNSLAVRTASVVSSAGFTHPGILNTQNSLAYAAQQVNNPNDPNNAARTSAYNYVLEFCNHW